MEIELIPAQPPEVDAAVAEALAAPEATSDPWWQAGNKDAIDT